MWCDRSWGWRPVCVCVCVCVYVSHHPGPDTTGFTGNLEMWHFATITSELLHKLNPNSGHCQCEPVGRDFIKVLHGVFHRWHWRDEWNLLNSQDNIHIKTEKQHVRDLQPCFHVLLPIYVITTTEHSENHQSAAQSPVNVVFLDREQTLQVEVCTSGIQSCQNVSVSKAS